MGRKYTDNALTTLASSITNVSTTLAVAAGRGDGFPSVIGHGAPGSTPDYFVITLENAAGVREKIRVEQRAAGNDTLGTAGFPLVRGYDGTIAAAWTAGDSVDLRPEHSGVQDMTDRVVPAAVAFGIKGSATSGLNFGYYGGVINVGGAITTIVDGAVALTLSQTNYVERTLAGVVSANTAGFTAGRVPLYIVVTDATGIQTITDQRQVVTQDAQGSLPVVTLAQAQGADVASAATINLDTVTGDYVNVTGVAAITAITLAQGHQRKVKFTGILTLTNGASLILPGAVNISTAAGDTAEFIGEAAGVVRCLRYAPLPPMDVQTFNASGTWTKPTGLPANAMALIQAWGAGGAGAKDAVNGGGGGAGGTYIERWVLASALGATEAVTIGAGGIGGTGVGGNGGNTIFGAWVTAIGGQGGKAAAGSDVGGIPSLFAVGDYVSPTTLVNPQTILGGPGGNGSTGTAGSGSIFGGGGGGGAQAGNVAAGIGGPSINGGQGGAAHGSAPVAGTAPGGGGGGSFSVNGANGAAGRIVVTIFR